MGYSKFSVKMTLLLTGPLENVAIIKVVRPRQSMTDEIIGGAYEGNPTIMTRKHVLLVPAQDIHNCGGPGGLIALVAIQVCGYQLLRRNDKGDYERSCSDVIAGTDDQPDQPFQSPIANRVTDRCQAVCMAFATLWEAQANVPQHALLRSVTSVQIVKLAQEICDVHHSHQQRPCELRHESHKRYVQEGRRPLWVLLWLLRPCGSSSYGAHADRDEVVTYLV
jgi:hypothetical protein